MIKVVLFDLDDTLYPEIDYVKSGFRRVSNQISKDYNVESYDLMLQLFNHDKTNVYNKALDKLCVKYNADYIQKLVEIYRNHEPDNLVFYSDVLPFLQKLKDENIKTGIITDGRVVSQQAKLQALNCYNLFDKIIITDSLGGEQYRKPHPKSYELMQEYFSVNYPQIIYIGDNPQKDFTIKSHHPITTIRITRQQGLYSKIQTNIEQKEDYSVKSLMEILRLL